MEISLALAGHYFSLASFSHKSQIQTQSHLQEEVKNCRSISQRSRQIQLHPISSIVPSNLNILLLVELNVLENGVTVNHQLSYSSKASLENSVTICARKNGRRLVSRKTTRFLIQSMSFIALKFTTLPEPLNVLIREFGAGNGGGGGRSGFWTQFGGGGFGGWSRRNKKSSFLEFLMLGALILFLGQQFESDLIVGFLGIAQFGISMNFCKRGFQNWVIGFCFFVGLMGLGLNRNELKKRIDKIRVCSPLMEITKMRKPCRRKM